MAKAKRPLNPEDEQESVVAEAGVDPDLTAEPVAEERCGQADGADHEIHRLEIDGGDIAGIFEQETARRSAVGGAPAREQTPGAIAPDDGGVFLAA